MIFLITSTDYQVTVDCSSTLEDVQVTLEHLPVNSLLKIIESQQATIESQQRTIEAQNETLKCQSKELDLQRTTVQLLMSDIRAQHPVLQPDNVDMAEVMIMVQEGAEATHQDFGGHDENKENDPPEEADQETAQEDRAAPEKDKGMKYNKNIKNRYIVGFMK